MNKKKDLLETNENTRDSQKEKIEKGKEDCFTDHQTTNEIQLHQRLFDKFSHLFICISLK